MYAIMCYYDINNDDYVMSAMLIVTSQSHDLNNGCYGVCISHMPHHFLRMALCNCLQCNQWCAVVISTMVIVTSWSHDFNNGLLLWSLVSPLVSQSGLSSSCSQAGGAAGERWGRHVHRGRWWKAGNKGFINPLHANFFQQNHKDPW